MIQTRLATRSDLPAMAGVINPIIRQGGTTAFEDKLSPDYLDGHIFGAPDLVSVVVALDAGGTVAGFQYVRRLDPPQTEVGGIASFARLSPKVPGAGRAMLAATLIEARAAGLREIEAKIRADNVPGLGFYSAMGFQDVSLIQGVPLKDGTPMDRVIKRMTL